MFYAETDIPNNNSTVKLEAYKLQSSPVFINHFIFSVKIERDHQFNTITVELLCKTTFSLHSIFDVQFTSIVLMKT